MIYITVLGLGIALLYTLRDGLLMLQNKRDAESAAELQQQPSTIIHTCEQHCKKNKLSA